MPAGILQVVHYPAANGPPSSWDVGFPTWDEVEQSILRLDRHHYPYIWLFRTAAGDEPDFSILGGDGAYVMYVLNDDGDTLKFHDSSRGDELVSVWTSDQGAAFPASDVCTNLNTVLTAAKHFYETGGALDAVAWRPVV